MNSGSVHAERGRHRQEKRLLADEADRDKVARHFERQVGLEPRQRDEGRRGGHVEGIAVGRGGSGGARRHGAAGTRMVEREDLPPPHLRQAVGDNPQQRVRGAARRRMGDDPHRPGRKILRLRPRES